MDFAAHRSYHEALPRAPWVPPAVRSPGPDPLRDLWWVAALVLAAHGSLMLDWLPTLTARAEQRPPPPILQTRIIRPAPALATPPAMPQTATTAQPAAFAEPEPAQSVAAPAPLTTPVEASPDAPPPAPAVVADSTSARTSHTTSPSGQDSEAAPLVIVTPDMAATSGPVRLAPAANLQYRQRGGEGGLAQLQWQPGEGHYRASWQAPGQLARVSEGRLDERGVAPLGLRAQAQATTQDRLSQWLQLGALLAGAPEHYPPGTAIALWTDDGRSARPWVFLVKGEEELAGSAGAFGPAIHLVHEPRGPGGARVELWLSPGLDHLPVRIRVAEPGQPISDHWLETGAS